MVLPKKESEKIEFKESFSDTKRIIETIVAFANTKGGIIYVGIDDYGKIKGVNLGKNTLNNLLHHVKRQVEPPVYPQFKELKENKKTIVKIIVKESDLKPHFYNGIALKRVNDMNVKMSAKELEELFIKKTSKKDFDTELIDASIEEIDESTVLKFIERVKTYRNIKFENLRHFLESLGLLINGRLTKGAIILFGKNPQKYFPHFTFMCNVYKESNIINFKSFEGNLFQQIEDVYEFVLFHLPVRIQIEGLTRKETPLIPAGVIREAIINSLVHRDYRISSPNYLEIYPTKIIITNPGSLEPPLSVNDLYKVHSSVLRNKFIAKVAFIAKYIEQWGYGTRKMAKEMLLNNLPLPKFIVDKYFFKVILSTEKDKKEEMLISALNLIKKYKEISSFELAKNLKVSDREARRILSFLIDLSLVEKKGSTKGARYVIIPADSD